MCAPDWEYIYAHEQNNFISPPPKTKDLLEERFYISTRVEQVFEQVPEQSLVNIYQGSSSTKDTWRL